MDQLGLIRLHLGWYPLMEPRDFYKLLYQGVMGAEHLVSSPEEYTHYLSLEFGRLLPDKAERLLEPVRPDQTLLRLNLRAYKSLQEDVQKLLPLLLETAQLLPGGQVVLGAAWDEFIRSCEQGLISSIKVTGLRRFTSWLERTCYPPVHHSETYRRQYQPAYRLISSSAVQQLGLSYAG